MLLCHSLLGLLPAHTALSVSQQHTPLPRALSAPDVMMLLCWAAWCLTHTPPTPTPTPSPTPAATYLQGRTDVQCLHRWQKVLNPNLVKGGWTPEVRERSTTNITVLRQQQPLSTHDA